VQNDIPPATVARTILALGTSVSLTVLEDDTASDAQRASLLGDPYVGIFLGQDGTAYLILRRGAETPTGRIRVECSAPGHGLGILHLEGTCSMPVPSELHATVHAQVSTPRPCPHGRACTSPHRTGPRDIAEIRLDSVRVHRPGHPAGEMHTIDPVAYASARPDPWLVDVSALRTHLEEGHQDLLRQLVAQRSPQLARATVTVHELTRTRLTAGCLSNDGVTLLTWHFDDAITSPSDIAGLIARAVTGTSRSPR